MVDLACKVSEKQKRSKPKGSIWENESRYNVLVVKSTEISSLLLESLEISYVSFFRTYEDFF